MSTCYTVIIKEEIDITKVKDTAVGFSIPTSPFKKLMSDVRNLKHKTAAI